MQPIQSSEIYELAGCARDRPNIYEQMLGFFGQHVFGFDLERKSTRQTQFQFHGRSRSVGGFTLIRAMSTTFERYRLLRDAARILGDGQDRYGLFISLRGDLGITQFGREQLIGPGSYTFVSTSEPVSLGNETTGGNDVMLFLIPGDFVGQRLVTAEDLCARAYHADHPLHRLVIESLNAFEDASWGLNEEDFQTTARIFAELVLHAASGSCDFLSGGQSVRASNLSRVKRIIRRRLSESTLTLADVANEAGLSLGYIHQLFSDAGYSMGEYLRAERLRKARALLSASRPQRTLITDIALDCGFSNMSHFSTAFRRAFGMSPREVMLRRAS